MMEHESEALQVLREAGLIVERIDWSGELRRVPVMDKPRGKDGAYVAHGDAPASLWWQNFPAGTSDTWTAKNGGKPLTAEEHRILQARWTEAKRQRDEERAREYAKAAKRAEVIYDAAAKCENHPYLTRKGVRTAPGLKVNKSGALLIVPAYNERRELTTLQFIKPEKDPTTNRDKNFLTGGKKGGCFFTIGMKAEGAEEKLLLICEGLATGLSLHECGGGPVVVAFDAGNLKPAAEIFRRMFPEREIILAADNDCETDGNPGVTMATAAAQAIGGRVAIPHMDGQAVDWNDLHQAKGPEEVRAQLEEAMTNVAAATITEPEDAERFRATDTWNADLFVKLHADKVRYCSKLRGWHTYDGTRWKRSELGEVERLAAETVLEIYRTSPLETDKKKREERARHAISSESVFRKKAILELAKNYEGIAVSSEAFDADPWLFNVENGTLDLRTGELHKHRPEDMLTNISPAQWQGMDARAPVFEKFLSDAMRGNQEEISFLQRAAGYSMSGDMREQVFFFLYGPEAAGKGTFTRAIAGVSGTYGRAAEIETFLLSRREKVRNDIASLVGSRLVMASEPEEGQTLDEGLIKTLTGQDRMSARFLHQEAFEFSATFKIWLQGNHRPRIPGTGGAMWRRVFMIPFTRTVPEDERDKTLGDKLQTPEERAGILSWLVLGCLDWQDGGLRPPDSVRAAIAEYRASEDRIQPFLDERVIIRADAEVSSKGLYSDYRSWCEENGEKPMTATRLGKRLAEKGFESGRNNRGRFWRGLHLARG